MKVERWDSRSTLYIQVSEWCCSWFNTHICLYKVLFKSSGKLFRINLLSEKRRQNLVELFIWQMVLDMWQEYKSFVSSPVHISPLDLGTKYAEKLGDSIKEYRKTYGENYCLGQLIYWYEQTNTDPDVTLVKATRGCLSLPDVASFYAKAQKPSKHRVYGPKTVKTMVSQMVKVLALTPLPKYIFTLSCYFFFSFISYYLCVHS